MSESRAVQKARKDLEAVKAKLAGELPFGEAAALAAEYNRLCHFIYYRTARYLGENPAHKKKPGL